MTLDARTRALLVGLAVVGLALRLGSLATKFTMTNDEGWSYLAATCNEGRYFESVVTSKTAPYGTWSVGESWLSFLRPVRALCFGTIVEDLARWDTHPPLYFWLLHGWVLIVGVHMWTGPLLNAFLDLGSMALLFRIALSLFETRAAALAVSFLWLASPAVLAASWEARSYPLLILLSLWTLAITLDVVATQQVRPAALARLALATGLGLLTHYYFAVFLAGCLLNLAWATRRSIRAQAGIGLAALAGLTMFAVLHPIHLQFARGFEAGGGAWTPAAGHYVFADRLRRVLETLPGFLSEYARLPYVVSYALMLLLLAVSLTSSRRRDSSARQEQVSPQGQACRYAALFQGGWVSAAIAGGYIAGVLPQHAMGNKYLSLFWPFAALGIVAMAARFDRKRAFYIAMCSWMFFSGLEFASRGLRWADARNDGILRSTGQLVVDTVHPGILIRLLFYVSPGQMLLAAHQADLPDRLTRSDVNDRTIFLATRSYSDTIRRETSLVRSLSRDCAVDDLEVSVNGTGRVYSIQCSSPKP